jgi:hypothetical protein
MSWLTIVQSISTFVTGTFGTTLVIIAVAIAGARAMLHGSWGHFWSAIGGARCWSAPPGWCRRFWAPAEMAGREMLYLALTRPALTWGVPFEALALNVMVTFAAGLELSAPTVWRSPVLFWAAAVPIHLGLRRLTS